MRRSFGSTSSSVDSLSPCTVKKSLLARMPPAMTTTVTVPVALRPPPSVTV